MALREKIGKIREVFEFQKSPRLDENNQNMVNHHTAPSDLHPFNETINIQFKEYSNPNKEMKKQQSKKKFSATKQ